jgi:hypothetical protein
MYGWTRKLVRPSTLIKKKKEIKSLKQGAIAKIFCINLCIRYRAESINLYSFDHMFICNIYSQIER